MPKLHIKNKKQFIFRLVSLAFIFVAVFAVFNFYSKANAEQNCWKSEQEILDTPSTMANFDWPMCSDLGDETDKPPVVDPFSQFDPPGTSDPMDSISNMDVPLRDQNDPANGALASKDCGPTSMGMIADYWRKMGYDNILNLSTADLAKIAGTGEGGTTMKQLFDLAQAIGFTNTDPGSTSIGGAIIDGIFGGPISFSRLEEAVSGGYPAIVNIDLDSYTNGHALVVTGISGGNVYVNNPDTGINQVYGEAQFKAMWGSRGYPYVIPKP